MFSGANQGGKAILKCFGVRITVYLVDGSLSKWHEGPDILRQLESLQSRGFSGKELVHALFTDDWGTPPVSVCISGTKPSGAAGQVTIPYY
ncbi:hypothetical protein P2G67_00170 [Fodinicurvata sp. CAU 1616]|uniref:Uncharacterized protein n=1 Tax=Aquibaculum arenosum TaxID=3032591 RepID=A0ABT5YHH5_9PROT|nr:hypothetical protein [Fodinicurvata sp. CAU 1616]